MLGHTSSMFPLLLLAFLQIRFLLGSLLLALWLSWRSPRSHRDCLGVGSVYGKAVRVTGRRGARQGNTVYGNTARLTRLGLSGDRKTPLGSSSCTAAATATAVNMTQG